MKAVSVLFQNIIFRYLFAIAMVGSMFALKIWLIPLTGTGAPFVLFFAAVLVTSLFAGVGPGICATLLSVPLGAYTFVVGAGYPVFQAAFQSLLFSVDGLVVIYLTFMMRKSKEKYRALFDSIDEGFCEIEVLFDDADKALDYRFLEVNRVFEKQTGISNAVGRRMREIAPAHEEHWFQIYGQIARTGESRRFENPALALGRFYDVYAFRLGRPEQRQVAILFNDITKRKQVEEALHRTQALNQAVLDSLAATIAVLDREGNIIAVNEAWKRFAHENDGAAFADSVGVNYLQVCRNASVSRDGGAAALNGIQAVLDGTHSNFVLEYPCHSPTQKRWFLTTVTPLVGERGGAVVTHMDITERRLAEEALLHVSSELRQTLQTAGTGLTHCSRDLRYLSANPAYSRLVGLPVEQIVGKPFIDVLGQAAFETVRPRVERVLSGERVEFEDELPIAGERKWIHAVYTPDRDASGNVVGWVASVIDITVRMRIEEELKAANAFLDAIIENIPLMLFIKDSQSLRFMRFNRTGEDLLGWPKETLIGKNDYDLWPKEQAEFFIAKDREALKSGSGVDIPEEPIQTRYRGVRILHTKKVPILDTTGNPIYLLGISEDISEPKRLEKEGQFLADVGVALSASLEYEQTLATLAQLVVQNIAGWCAVDVINEEGQLSRLKVASADPAKAALCAVLEGMPPDRGLPYLMQSVMESKQPLINAHVSPEYFESIAQAQEHLQALLDTEVTSLIVVPLLMRGQALGALFLGSSTLSRVFGQSDLRLAEALAERAAMAIENARLYRASVRATQLRDQVLGVVVHDLRSPLSNILLQLSALKRQGPELERRSQKPMEVIHRAATRMNRLIQDLLDVALMEAGQLTIEQARISADGLIADAVDLQRALASSSSLELRVEVDADLPGVWGDWDRLLQVFENLIGNAIKFTRAGGRITVGASPRDDEVVFRVADTGEGIDSENLPRIFDRFWQASRAGRRGAGLGLSIAKAIVAAHGGRIWVESMAGRGSTFFFTIPRASAAQDRLSDRRRPDRAA